MRYSDVERIFLYSDPVDLRKGANSLLDFVESEMGKDPFDSDCIYFFINRRHNLIKGIQYDCGRSSLHIERPPEGTFKWKRWCSDIVSEIDSEEFDKLLKSWNKE